MANRGTKGRWLAGKFVQDKPGFPEVGGIVVSTVATTGDTTTGFSFNSYDVLESIYVKVTSPTSTTSGTLNLGLLTSFPTGFASGIPINTSGTKALWVASSSGDAPNSFYATSYLGVLLGAMYAGTTEGSTGKATAAGSLVLRRYNMDTTTQTTLSYSSNTTAAFTAVVYPIYHTLNS